MLSVQCQIYFGTEHHIYKLRFDKYTPTYQLKPYIKYFVVSENELANEINIIEQFLLWQLKHIYTDMLIVDAVKLIY